jgi:hypothetical protein
VERGLGFNHGEAQPRKGEEEKFQLLLHGFSHNTYFIAQPGRGYKRFLPAYATLKIMKVLVLYRPNSEHARLIEEFVRDYQSRHQPDHLEVLNIDTREGSATATLYDIMQYPAILVLHTDGYVQKIWQGDSLPLMDEVSAYVTA